ncbi:CRISPR-associated ring nuclease Csm6 [uncultured Shewanella sp.]|uniref:CRISPR-associated ring nuclease Csm6 n=1 Tax=uncultured Shewanella sp. TaxID=173975 RepID=UPI002626EF9C|nr:CRISPR-associated ring nuclease Csm6 [uncultured Shewanella sp.]
MKHILIAVSGMTPQIITETLYGIHKKDKSQLPSEIHVITTGAGSDKLISALMGSDNKLEQFCRDYQLPPISFTQDHIHIPRGDDGEKIVDVRSEREQEIIADYITQFIRDKTTHPDVTIHASLAGGRKTMGFAMGYAMSLFGRHQDSLSHVLVSEPYEIVPDFFYPTPLETWRADRNGSRHDLSKAEVTLATIPLVLMREEMPTALVSNTQLSYTETVSRINQANTIDAEGASINLDYQRLAINCDGYEVIMKPDCFAFYSWLAKDSKDNPGEGIEAPSKGMTCRELNQRLRDFYLALLPLHLPHSDEYSKMALEDLDGELKDYLDRLSPQPRNRWLLQDNDNTHQLLNADLHTDAAELIKKHTTLWHRLLRETNKALEEVMGKKLAKFYQIQNVNHMKGEVSTAVQDFKGLAIQADKIKFMN